MQRRKSARSGLIVSSEERRGEAQAIKRREKLSAPCGKTPPYKSGSTALSSVRHVPRHDESNFVWSRSGIAAHPGIRCPLEDRIRNPRLRGKNATPCQSDAVGSSTLPSLSTVGCFSASATPPFAPPPMRTAAARRRVLQQRIVHRLSTPAGSGHWPGARHSCKCAHFRAPPSPVCHPSDEDLSLGTRVCHPKRRRPVAGDPGFGTLSYRRRWNWLAHHVETAPQPRPGLPVNVWSNPDQQRNRCQRRRARDKRRNPPGSA